METASLSEIRNEIKTLQPAELQDIILRLAKFKIENKQLISFLLFNATNEILFLQSCCNDIDNQFMQINQSSHLFIKKSLRKGLRMTNQFIKFAGSPRVEIELLLYFCKKMKQSGFNRRSHPVIWNIYQRQVLRITKVFGTLHEDLQYDYQEALENL